MSAGRGAAELAALERAKSRLDRLPWYPRPVSITRVRIFSWPWFFRLPYLSRFVGYSSYGLVLLKEPLGEAGEDLVVHELCHVWQMQHHRLRMPLSYLVRDYATNPNERQARAAVELTR